MILFDALLDLAQTLRGVRFGTATGGSTTTLVDTGLSDPNDFYNGGTIFFISGNNANKSAVITDWNSTTHTFTFATQTGACAAADRYAAIHNIYNRDTLVEAINQALEDLGPFTATNTALTTIADTEAYTLPTGVSAVKKVEIATSTTAPYGWYELRQWREVNGTLYINENVEPWAGYTIRLWYEADHTYTTTDAGTLNVDIHPEVLKWVAATKALTNRLGVTLGSEPQVQKMLEYAQVKAEEAKAKFPVMRVRKTPRWPAFPGVNKW